MICLLQYAYAQDLSAPSKNAVLWLNNPIGLVNNVEHRLDVNPFMKDGRTMVPLRFIGESLGAQVGWSVSEQKITISLDGNSVILWIGKSEARINNNTISMDVPAMISNSRTLVPLRFVSENLKLKVDFNNETQQITITSGNPKGQQSVTPTTLPQSANERTVRDLVSSNKKYIGLSTQGDYSSKYSIIFTDFEQTGEFKGKIEWIGYNVTDDLVGLISGDEIFFKQIARYQNNRSNPMDVDVTMRIESSSRVSGEWEDKLTGNIGTTWFEYAPIETTPAKFIGNFDAKGFPTGKATVNCGNNITFDGEVKVEANNLIAMGVINYPDGTKVIGRFVNGRPDGLSSIIYPNETAYLIDFVYGEPIDVYVANTIPTYRADELEVYKAHDIEIFQAEDVEYFQADDIEYFQADDIEPYKAEMIELYQAEQVDRFESVNIERYKAEVVKLSPPGSSPSIPIGGFTSPNYMNPLVQMWTSHMMKLPYLINNNMTYAY